MWLSLKTLRSKVLASLPIATAFLASCFLMSSRWTEEIAMVSFQECAQLAIAPTTRLTHSTPADKLLGFLLVSADMT